MEIDVLLDLQPYCPFSHTVLATTLYLQPYCTCNHILLATIQHWANLWVHMILFKWGEKSEA